MKLRTIAASAVLLLCLAACDRNANRFTVSGKVTDTLATMPGSMVYLIDAAGPVDSTAVVKGAFSFKGDIDLTKQLVVMLRFPERDKYDDRFLVSFVPDAERINIDLDYPATVSGSPLTDAITNYRESVMNLFYEHESDIGSLTMNGQTDRADSIYREQMKKIDDLSRETYLANTGNVLGKQAISQLFNDLDVSQLEELLAQGSDFIRNDPELNSLLQTKKNAQATGIGSKFIEISGLRADGSPVTLSEFVGKGNYVLADFWASWCGPCMQAIPTLRQLRDTYAPKGLKVVGINVWEQKAEEGPACAKEQNMDWDLIFTSGNEAAEAYGIEGIPTLILFAPDGTIAQRLLGGEGIEEVLEKCFE
ncbi:MAG: AhpC/TSA family protein [Bacteroidales bacterium]|nr:AhpC/TSA family protein [Bacteroidales bacterium]